MIFFDDTSQERPRIEKCIKKFGYAPEHNFEWYQCQPKNLEKNVFVEFKDGSGLLTIETPDKKESCVFSDPIAPPLRRSKILIEYLNKSFKSKRILKAKLELENELYKIFIKDLPKNIKAMRIRYTLTWPIYELDDFEPALSGNRWKSLRKIKNRFYKEHSVEILDAKKYENKKDLHDIIDVWRKNRGGKDRAYHHEYHELIEKNFSGTTEARVFLANGIARGINAGWLIPNSDKFYGAIGIHDYSLPGLGDTLYLEDLAWLKSKGYKQVNMGGEKKRLQISKINFIQNLFTKRIYLM